LTPPHRIAFLGLGLIGGSIARAIRADAAVPLELVAWSPTGLGPAAALAAGVVDAAPNDPVEAIEGADLVVLAGPALAVLEAIGALSRNGMPVRALAGDATLTDIASTKRMVIAAADEAGLPFVGGHPMAGRETSGFAASDPDLFRGRPWVIVPGRHARSDDVARVEWLARVAGAQPVHATAEEHDAAVAAISHLPLVVSAALAEAVAGTAAWPSSLAHALASTGWASATRLARGEPGMGASMLATNARPTAAALRSLRDVLDAWLAALDAAPPAAPDLRDRLERARLALER
jgi:prephenate dehydrogenase